MRTMDIAKAKLVALYTQLSTQCAEAMSHHHVSGAVPDKLNDTIESLRPCPAEANLKECGALYALADSLLAQPLSELEKFKKVRRTLSDIHRTCIESLDHD